MIFSVSSKFDPRILYTLTGPVFKADLPLLETISGGSPASPGADFRGFNLTAG